MSGFQNVDDDIVAAREARDALVVAQNLARHAAGETPALVAGGDDKQDLVDGATGVPFKTAFVAPSGTSYLPLVAAGAAVEDVGAVEARVRTVAASGSTEDLDVSLYQVFKVVMDQNCTFTFSNPAPAGAASSFILVLSGFGVPTFPSMEWPNDQVPTYEFASVYSFLYISGTGWIGSQIGRGYSFA